MAELASPPDEVFDVCNEENVVIGQARRADVHKQGLLHRAVNLLVFRDDGQLLLQRRSPHKDVCPNRWDLSVGEHLQPGESYHAGAVRGLFEELGIEASPDQVKQARGTHLNSFSYPDAGRIDNEFNELYTYTLRGEEIKPSAAEVAEIRYADIESLLKEMEDKPDSFTPWCLAEVRAWKSSSPSA